MRCIAMPVPICELWFSHEDLRDLLNPNSSGDRPTIHERLDGTIYVEGLSACLTYTRRSTHCNLTV